MSTTRSHIKTVLSGFVFGTTLALSGLSTVLNPSQSAFFFGSSNTPFAGGAGADHHDHDHKAMMESINGLMMKQQRRGQNRFGRHGHDDDENYWIFGGILDFLISFYRFLSGNHFDHGDDDVVVGVVGGRAVYTDVNVNSSADGNKYYNYNYYIILVCLTASITSTVAIYLANNDKFRFVRLKARKASKYRWFAFDGNVVGGFVQGLGMAVLKSEPGLMVLNLGVGIASFLVSSSSSSSSSSSRVMTISSSLIRSANLGGLLAGFVFVLGNHRFRRRIGSTVATTTAAAAAAALQQGRSGRVAVGQIQQKDKTKSMDTLPERLGISTGLFVAIFTALALLCVGCLLVKQDQEGGRVVLDPIMLRAMLGGAGIGLSQLVSILLTRGTLGVSSVYPALATHCLRLLRVTDNPSPGYASLLFTAGVIISGGVHAFVVDSRKLFPVSSVLEESTTITTTTSTTIAVLGGFCVVFGARLAGGCTSGHGLSGCGLLSVSSFITVLSMICGILVPTVVAPNLASLLR